MRKLLGRSRLKAEAEERMRSVVDHVVDDIITIDVSGIVTIERGVLIDLLHKSETGGGS